MAYEELENESDTATEQKAGGEQEPETPEAPETPQAVAEQPKAPKPAKELTSQYQGPQIIDAQGNRVNEPSPADPNAAAREAFDAKERLQAQMFARLPPQAQAQFIYDRLKLNNSEQMELQRTENAVGAVEARPDLERWEKDNLITKLRTKSDPLKERQLKAQVMQEEQQTQAQAAAAKRIQDTYNAGKVSEAAAGAQAADASTKRTHEGDELKWNEKKGEYVPVPQDKERAAAKVQEAKLAHEERQRDHEEEQTFRKDLHDSIHAVNERHEKEMTAWHKKNDDLKPEDRAPMPAFDKKAELHQEMRDRQHPSANILDKPFMKKRIAKQEAEQRRLAEAMAAAAGPPEQGIAAFNEGHAAGEDAYRAAAGYPARPGAAPAAPAPPPAPLPAAVAKADLKPFKVSDVNGRPKPSEDIHPVQREAIQAMEEIRDKMAVYPFPSMKEAKGHVEDADEMIRLYAKAGSVENMTPDERERFLKQKAYWKSFFKEPPGRQPRPSIGQRLDNIANDVFSRIGR